MKRTAIFLTIFFCACQEESKTVPPTPEAVVPNSKTVSKEVAGGVRDVLANKGPKWKVDYTGDLTGSVQGNIMTAMSSPMHTSVLGKGMNASKTGAAKASFQATFMAGDNDQDRPVNANLTLEDGTKCKEDIKVGFSKGKLIDKTTETFKAEISGNLVCGDDKSKKIAYKAFLSKKP
ncbi:MAG: hypothetical protein R3E66_04590 [bacterium]